MSAKADLGKGRVYQPAGRKFFMVAYWGPTKDGKLGLIRESAQTRDRAEAESYLAKKLRDAANWRDGIARTFETAKQKRVSVGDLLDDLLAEYERREVKSLDSIRFRVREGSSLRKAFGAMLTDALTPDRVVAYTDARRREGAAPATVNRETELLGRALHLALERQKIARAATMPPRLRENNARHGFYETADFEKLASFLPEPLDDLARFAFMIGWRRGELLGLRWEFVSETEVRIPDSKNGEGRSVPVTASLVAILERRKAARSYSTPTGVALSSLVFHRHGKPINRTVFGKQFRRAAEKAGLGKTTKREDGSVEYSGVIFHDLRRTAVRNMIRGGVPQSVAMRVTGHKTASMFTRYDITDAKDKAGAIEAAARYAEATREKSNVVAINEGRK
jgi:integrase